MFGQSALPVGGGVVAVVRQEVAVDSPVGGGVVAVVRQEVAVELPEHSQRDAAVRRRDVVISHFEHVVELGQVEVRVEQLVRQAVTLQQRLQLLTHTQQHNTFTHASLGAAAAVLIITTAYTSNNTRLV